MIPLETCFFSKVAISRSVIEKETSKYTYAYGLRWARGYPRGLVGNLTRLWPASVGPAAPSLATPKGGEVEALLHLQRFVHDPSIHPVTIGSTSSSVPFIIRGKGGVGDAYTANLSRCNVIFLRSRGARSRYAAMAHAGL